MGLRLWFQRMIIVLIVLMMLGFGMTTMVEATEASKGEIKLTEEFLTGTWVCSEGFACKYENDVFTNPSGMIYKKCTISQGVVSGTTYRNETGSTKITIIDKDTILVGGYTAVRVESKLGKEYQMQLANQIIGKWMNYDMNREVCYEFTKDNRVIASSNEEEFKFGYEMIAGGIRVYLTESARGEIEEDIVYLRIHEGTLSFCENDELKLNREGSEAGIASQSGRAEVIGDWIFASEDGKLISQWKIDSSNILTIDYFGKEKDIQQAFSTSRKDYFIIITMGEKIYQLNRITSSDNTIAYNVSQDLNGILVRKDSEKGKYYIKKANTIYKEGKEIQRTQYKKFNETLHPEVTAISVSLQCMSNLWLDDLINMETYSNNPLNRLPGICGQSYEVVCDTTLKNAKITFSHDESQLPYAYEKDLVIVHMDKKQVRRPC